MAPDLGGKRLELLKELLPRLGRVAVLWNATNPYVALVYKQTQAAGRTLGIEVQSLEVRGPDDFEGAFEAVRQQHSDALITVEDPLTGAYRERIVHFAAVDRLRSLHGLREEVVAGGLISYGANFADLFRRAAGYVDKCLSVWGPDADRRAKLLIHLAVEGARFGPHTAFVDSTTPPDAPPCESIELRMLVLHKGD